MTDALVEHDRLAQALPVRLRSTAANPTVPAGLSFRHILVPLDGSSFAERALQYLRAIARGTSPRVTLFRSVEALQRPGARASDPVEFEMMRADAQAYLASVGDSLRSHGLNSEVFIAQGSAADHENGEGPGVWHICRAQQGPYRIARQPDRLVLFTRVPARLAASLRRHG